MKTFPYFAVAAIASFILTYSALGAAFDDQGAQHWVAQQTSAIAAIAGIFG